MEHKTGQMGFVKMRNRGSSVFIINGQRRLRLAATSQLGQ